MSNYQILEIALDITFFATVASVMVIFAIIREKFVRKNLTEQYGMALFPEALAEAGSPVPSAEDLLGEHKKTDSRRNVPTYAGSDEVTVPRYRELSRSEMELMSSRSSTTARS